MARGLTDDTHYQAIANAIRSKNGLTDTYTPAEMAPAIRAIETGIKPDRLENQAPPEQIGTGYAAYDSDGNVIEGSADVRGYDVGYVEGAASRDDEVDALTEQVETLTEERDAAHQAGYNEGNEAGYAAGYAQGTEDAALEELENQAGAAEILKGYAAYNGKGQVIQGTTEKGVVLRPLATPAGAAQILSGYQAYDDDGTLITGAGELFESQAVFTLEAGKWNGTTYTVTTTAWRVSDTATALMDLPYTSSAVNAQRVVEAGITMPSCSTATNTNSSTGVTTYTTTIIFSAITTPPVDVDVAVFNLVEVS